MVIGDLFRKQIGLNKRFNISATAAAQIALNQGCTTPRRQVVVATILCIVPPMYGSSVRNWLLGTLLRLEF